MLNISRALKNPGQTYPIRVELPGETVEIMGDEVVLSEVVFEGVFLGAGEEINVNGNISATVNTHCANCLAPVKAVVRAQLDEVFVKDGDGEEAYPLLGYEIDLEPVIREAVLLELPFRFLCSEDCKGLCPVCGKNRNKELCTCPKEGRVANPFSALNSLLTERNNEEV